MPMSSAIRVSRISLRLEPDIAELSYAYPVKRAPCPRQSFLKSRLRNIASDALIRQTLQRRLDLPLEGIHLSSRLHA